MGTPTGVMFKGLRRQHEEAPIGQQMEQSEHAERLKMQWTETRV